MSLLILRLIQSAFLFNKCDDGVSQKAILHDHSHYCVLSQQGELLDLSSGAFSLEEDGSLHIASPGANESGDFVCTATNAAGYSSRKVQLTVYG